MKVNLQTRVPPESHKALKRLVDKARSALCLLEESASGSPLPLLFRILFLLRAKSMGIRIFPSGLERAKEEWERLPGPCIEALQDLNEAGRSFVSSDRLWDVRVFGYLYESLLEHTGDRRSLGIFFTPQSVVAPMVEDAISFLLRHAEGPEEVLDLKVLDPAMGTGHFLATAGEFLAQIHAAAVEGEVASSRRIIAENCLYGVDLDGTAVELARLRLWLFACHDEKETSFCLEHRLKQGDALFGAWKGDQGDPWNRKKADDRVERLYCGKGGPHTVRPDFFHWELEFPEIFREGRGFSLVLGNPPYGDLLSRHAKEALSRFGYPPSGGRSEIYAPFLIQGLRLLKPEGRLAFILPNTLLKGRQFGRLRKEITERSCVISIQDFRASRVFKDAETYTMILHLFKEPRPDEPYDALCLRLEPESAHPVLERMRIPSGSTEPWRVVDPLVEALEASGLVEPLSPGVADCRDAGLDYKYKAVGWTERGRRPRLKDMLVYSGSRRHGGDKPIVQGRDIDAFRIRETERYLIHDWDKYRSQESTVIVYPDLMEVPVKILTRQTSDRLVAAIDREGRYTAKSVHTVIVRDDRWTPEFVCALLNSKVMNQIYERLAGERGRTFAQVRVSDLRILPVRRVKPVREGLRHPLWKRKGDALEGWIREGETESCLQFMEEAGRDLPDLAQALAKELVCRMEAEPEAIPALHEILDALFSRLYDPKAIQEA